VNQKYSLGWKLILTIGLMALAILQANRAAAHDETPVGSLDILDYLGFEQRLNEQLPLDLTFRNEAGQVTPLSTYFDQRPVILAMGYYECPNLCSLVRVGLLEAVQSLQFDTGVEYEVVLISIDPTETPEVAARVKEETLEVYGRSGAEAGWHFLTGEHDNIDLVADAIGFHYAYDGVREQYAHASGIVVLTPTGKVARYFFGLEYEPRDLRLGLIEAANNRIGNVIDQVLLFCFHYDPTLGQYTLAIMTIMRIAGTLTVLIIAGAIWWMLRQESPPRRVGVG
jgi:protein SCO1